MDEAEAKEKLEDTGICELCDKPLGEVSVCLSCWNNMAPKVNQLQDEVRKWKKEVIKWQDADSGNQEKIERLKKIIHPCKTCNGIGKLDDADPGDISFNEWPCPDCDGFNVYAERDLISQPK